MKYKKVIEIALRLGTDNNFGHDYLKDFEERFLIKNQETLFQLVGKESMIFVKVVTASENWVLS